MNWVEECVVPHWTNASTQHASLSGSCYLLLCHSLAAVAVRGSETGAPHSSLFNLAQKCVEYSERERRRLRSTIPRPLTPAWGSHGFRFWMREQVKFFRRTWTIAWSNESLRQLSVGWSRNSEDGEGVLRTKGLLFSTYENCRTTLVSDVTEPWCSVVISTGANSLI